jgi:hypothetical protein
MIGATMKTALAILILAPIGLVHRYQADAGKPNSPVPIDPQPRVEYRFNGDMRFGLTVVKDPQGRATSKALTYASDGGTNTTVVRIDGKDAYFGDGAGKWLAKEETIPVDPIWEAPAGKQSVWRTGKLQITQMLQVIPSKQPVELAKGGPRRLLDTLLIRYRIENKNDKVHAVGLRFLLDTMIGNNDGVPFIVPGLPHLIGAKASADFGKIKEVPDFVQALEKPDLKDPGTVAHLTLKLDGLMAPDRVLLTRYQRDQPWEIPVQNIENDSAVVLYWNPRDLLPGQTREIGFAYGVGSFASVAGQLGVSVAGSFYKGELFSITAFVREPAKNQSLTLQMPSPLQLVEGKAKQVLGPSKDGAALVTWKIKATQSGDFPLEIQSSTGPTEKRVITIMPGETVHAKAADTVIDLTWKAPEGLKVIGYRVYRPEAKQPIHGEVLLPEATFRDLGLTNGRTYVYLVRAVLADGSEWAGYRPAMAVAGKKRY